MKVCSFITLVMLGSMIQAPWATAASGGPSYSSLRNVVLGLDELGAGEEAEFDINADGVVDVADLVSYVRSLEDLLPGVNFTRSKTTVSEAFDTLHLEVAVAEGYTGSIAYVVDGTAISGADFAHSGVVSLDGQFGFLEIELLDDGEIEDVETIRVTLIPDEGFQIGFQQQHVVEIVDNDIAWSATQEIGSLRYDLTFSLIRIGISVEAEIVSDGSDGLPAGVWPAEVTMAPGEFNAVVGPIPVGRGETLLGSDLERLLMFEASASTDGHRVDYERVIVGDLMDTWYSVDGAEHLNRTGEEAIQGRFVMTPTAPFTPIPASGLEVLE